MQELPSLKPIETTCEAYKSLCQIDKDPKIENCILEKFNYEYLGPRTLGERKVILFKNKGTGECTIVGEDLDTLLPWNKGESQAIEPYKQTQADVVETGIRCQLFKDKVEKVKRKIPEKNLKDFKLVLSNIKDPDLNGWYAGETFLSVPIESITNTPAYFTGLLANKIRKNCPSLYLFNTAAKTLVNSVELKLNSLSEEEKKYLLNSCVETKQLALELINLFNDASLFIEKALNAKEDLKMASNRSKALMQQYCIRHQKLWGVGQQYESKPPKIVGSQKFLFSKYFHETNVFPEPYPTWESEIVKERVKETILKQHPWWFDGSVLSSTGMEIYKKQKNEFIEPFVSEIRSLGFEKIGIQPAKYNFNTKPCQGLDKIRFCANIFLRVPNAKKLCKFNFQDLLIHASYYNTVSYDLKLKMDGQYKSNPKITPEIASLINQNSALHLSGNHIRRKCLVNLDVLFEYNDQQHYHIEAHPKSLFQVEDLQKIPPPTLDPVVLNKYNSNFLHVLNNYREYCSSLFFKLECEDTNLFIQKFGSNTEECFLPSIKNNLLPLVFPKNFLDYWISILLPENASLMALGEGVFLPFYDLIPPSVSGNGDPYQLAIEFCYYAKNSTVPKMFGKVVVAEFDRKTIDSFKKIKTTKNGEPEVEKAPRKNEFLFQAMYTDVLGSGLSDKLSYRLSNGQYVAAHETPFIGIYNLLEKQPKQKLVFDSTHYDEQIHNRLVKFLETGDAADAGNFAKLAIFESGKDHQEIDALIKDVRLNPYKKKHKAFAAYRESYYLLQAFAKLVCDADKEAIAKLMEYYLGLEEPNEVQKLRENAPDVEAFMKMIQKSPTSHLNELLEQKRSLDILIDQISMASKDNLPVPEQLSWILPAFPKTEH